MFSLAFSGDGDCGSTLRRGAEDLQKRIAGDPGILDYLTTLLRTVADVAENTMGGSSGAMYSILTEAAASSVERQEQLSADGLAEAFSQGVEAMQVMNILISTHFHHQYFSGAVKISFCLKLPL